jgi:hypothetical protein
MQLELHIEINKCKAENEFRGGTEADRFTA